MGGSKIIDPPSFELFKKVWNGNFMSWGAAPNGCFFVLPALKRIILIESIWFMG